MATSSVIFKNISSLRNLSTFRRDFTVGRIIYTKKSTGASSTAAAHNPVKVTGLSKNVMDVPKDPVGPGASKQTNYKNPEYFCYNRNSFYEAEVEMASYRLPQPSNKHA